MLLTDWIFIVILAVLIGLPFASAYPTFDTFPYDLFYSALGSVSVVILAWERIASSRMEQLSRLMKRVYLDSGEDEDWVKDGKVINYTG